MQLTAEGWRNLQEELSDLEAKSQALPLESMEFSEDGDAEPISIAQIPITTIRANITPYTSGTFTVGIRAH